jgi:hypothetical protein
MIKIRMRGVGLVAEGETKKCIHSSGWKTSWQPSYKDLNSAAKKKTALL